MYNFGDQCLSLDDIRKRYAECEHRLVVDAERSQHLISEHTACRRFISGDAKDIYSSIVIDI